MAEQVKNPARKVKFGNRERYSFSKIRDVLDIPDLVEVQKHSYKVFLDEGIEDVLKDFSPIEDYSGNVQLYFLSHSFEGEPKYSEKECKDRDATFARPLKVRARLVYRDPETGRYGDAKEQDVFMGDLPLMTENGSFIINGAERVIVSQLVRSPGVYCDVTKDKTGADLYSATIIPTRGAWLEFEEDSTGVLHVHIDRNRKVTTTVLLRSLGIGSDDELRALFHDHPFIGKTCEKDRLKDDQPMNVEQALYELNKRLRPGEVSTPESVRTYINAMLFDPKRYDLARVGRYKFNKKLALGARLAGQVVAEPVISPDGEVLAVPGEKIDEKRAFDIQNAGVNEVAVKVTGDVEVFYIRGNATVDLAKTSVWKAIEAERAAAGEEMPTLAALKIRERVHYPTLVKLLEGVTSAGKRLDILRENAEELQHKHIVLDDILATMSYTVGRHYKIGADDDIDHLGNRRVRSVGELLQNQFRLGFTRLERVIKERMQIQDNKDLTPLSLINIRPVSSAVKEFFGSSQLSQFMDQSNPIAELTHKRKLSALGPGGLNRERASFDVRDVHYTHYGRMCPIETPEGQNIGLISSLSTYSRINEYGFIEAPYRKVDKAKQTVTDHVDYLTADDEDRYVVASANEPLDENQWFSRPRVMTRYRDDIAEKERELVDYMDVSPRQLVSVATSLIPFLENDDTNRALMGSNMQRQAVPLLCPQAPIIGTGMEHKVAYDSGVMVLAKNEGVVDYVSAEEIRVRHKDGLDIHRLQKFQRSNQGTCMNQKPLCKKGDKVLRGTVLADGPSTDNTELALGRNILIGFMSWEGYNYEDAILISEELVREDVFTSIHIEEHELDARDTKLGKEEVTRDIPNVGEDALKNLDECGIIRIGAEVLPGDILVGKVTPKGETDLTPEERLLRAIFGDKAREVRDTSLRVPHGEGGIVVDVKIFSREQKDELTPGVLKLVRVYIAQKRKISVGDKMAGRHGNKGVISRILPKEDMPFMADGTPLQIVLNPLGVPSRMNIGQVLEVHLGLVAKFLGLHIATPVFDGARETDIELLLKQNGIACKADGEVDGKIRLYDGRTGQPFENRVTVGYMYMLKLVHLVDDKIHARSTGPYSLVTQQPLGGKAQFGGQRFGEMEVWALYAYGASNILQEIMTVKSDDVLGRVKAYESIVKGQNIPHPGVPESFKVLIKELQALALEVKVRSETGDEISIDKITEDDRDIMDIDSGKYVPQFEGYDRRRIDMEELEDLDEEEKDDAKGKAARQQHIPNVADLLDLDDDDEADAALPAIDTLDDDDDLADIDDLGNLLGLTDDDDDEPADPSDDAPKKSGLFGRGKKKP